jgi:hypothetical protein
MLAVKRAPNQYFLIKAHTEFKDQNVTSLEDSTYVKHTKALILLFGAGGESSTMSLSARGRVAPMIGVPVSETTQSAKPGRRVCRRPRHHGAER